MSHGSDRILLEGRGSRQGRGRMARRRGVDRNNDDNNNAEGAHEPWRPKKTDAVIVGRPALLAAELRCRHAAIGYRSAVRARPRRTSSRDELRFFQRQDLRPNPKRQPVTWRPNARSTRCAASATATKRAAAPSITARSVASSRGRLPAPASHTIERRYGAAAILEDLARRLAPELVQDLLEQLPHGAEYEIGRFGKAGNLEGQKITGGNVFEAAPARIPAAAARYRSTCRRPVRRGRLQARLSPVLAAPCHHLALPGPAGLHLLRLLPARLPVRRGEVEYAFVTLPLADATGNFKLITGAMCHRRQRQ